MSDNVVHYKDCSRYNWHDPDARCDGARCHPDPTHTADYVCQHCGLRMTECETVQGGHVIRGEVPDLCGPVVQDADYVARPRIFLTPMCDSPAASAMARSDAPPALICRIASSLRSVASRAFLLQEATSLAVTSSAEPGACPEPPGRTPGRPRRPGRPAAGWGSPGSPGLLRHVGDVPGGVLGRHALEGEAVNVAAGAADLEAGKGSSLAGENCGDGGEVSGHGGLLLPLGGGSGGVCGGHGFSKPCFHGPVNKVSKETGSHEHVYRCQDCGEIGRGPAAHSDGGGA